MKKSFYQFTVLVFFFIFLISCSNEPTKEKEEIIPQLIIGDPSNYGSDSLIIFPVGMTYIPKQSGDPDAYKDEYRPMESTNEANGRSNVNYNVKMTDNNISNSYGQIAVFENQEIENVDIRNLIFYNKFSGESHKLIDEKLHIISFSIHYEFGEPLIMYDVVKNDYNEDSLFNRLDPVMLYISDMHGNNFTQLTPENETYLTYFYYAESGRLLLKVSADGDGNKCFDPYDQTIFREVDLKNPAMGKTLFGEDMIEDLKSQI